MTTTCVQFITSNLHTVSQHPLRSNYLDGLGEAQELFLEEFVTRSTLFDIIVETVMAGYAAVVGCDGDDDDLRLLLVEYHLEPEFIKNSDEIFQKLVDEKGIVKAYIKSFDALAVASAAKIQKRLRVLGCLYRDNIIGNNHHTITTEQHLPEGIVSRLAESGDVASIAAINDYEELFQTQDEIKQYISKQQIILFHREEKDLLVGFSIFARVIKGRPEFDVGMLVAAPYRRQGLGTKFLSLAVQRVQESGGRPTMGCAIENIASRGCIEKLGYFSKYRMLNFEFV